jgi:hypothetical protein
VAVLMVESLLETLVGFVYLCAVVGCVAVFCAAAAFAHVLEVIAANPLAWIF